MCCGGMGIVFYEGIVVAKGTRAAPGRDGGRRKENGSKLRDGEL